jgi:predicted ATPase/signal transduction histidine kinase
MLSSQCSDLPGYELTEELYSGSRTIVYRGRHTADNRAVVIKLLNQDYPSFQDLLQFQNQYVITQDLDINGIVQPLSLLTVGNTYALIMADSGEISLYQYCRSQPLSIDVFLPIAIQLSQILQELHHHQIIHKDIKPANILIHPASQQVKLIDFSIASRLPKETEEMKPPHGLRGTLAYIAPEQTGRMNRGIDYRTDFYSLGVTFFELLTGRLPFLTRDPLELIHAHIAQPAPDLCTIRPEIPTPIAQIIHKLLAKTAEDRYQSSTGLTADLENCLQQWQTTGSILQFAIAAQDHSDRFTIPEKLYGRETEVAQLLAAFARVASPKGDRGNAEMMLVAGFSGIGKTVVINEVHKPITRQQGYFVKGKYDQFQRNVPLSALVQAFRSLIRQLLSESNAQLEHWRRKILAAFGDNAQVMIEVIPELEHIIGKQPIVSELSGSAAQNRFNLLFQKLIQVFTSSDHPLVIFLDDLQWADSASLVLLPVLMQDSGHLLVLGAYRDNEVFPGHPWMLTLAAIAKTTPVHTITLKPLSQGSLNCLVADTLNCDLLLAQPLTELIARKTQGNPFFATQLLKVLQQDGLIYWNPQANYWECDFARLQDATLTDDVVEFMITQLQRLPQHTQDALKLAACIGNQFDLATLAIVMQQSAVEVASALWRALQEGLILPQNEVYKFYLGDHNLGQNTAEVSHYRFLHDRVQQAAYSLIAATDRAQVHYQMGHLMLQKLTAAERAEKVFEIVGHLNLSLHLITQAEERDTLIHLNTIAIQKAKASTAYVAAISYVEAALQILGETAWQSAPPITRALYEQYAEIAYLNADFERALELTQIIIQQTDDILDRIKAYELSVQIYIAIDQQMQAIETGLQTLEKLGISLVNGDVDYRSQMPTPESLIHQPPMTQVESLAAIRILITITPPVHHVKPELFPGIALTMMHICLTGGYSTLTAFVYGIYGLYLCAVLGDVESAYQAGHLSLHLLEQYPAKDIQTKVQMLFGVFVCAGKEHTRNTLKLFAEGIQNGLEVGDIEYTSYCIMADCAQQILVGNDLATIAQQHQGYLDLLTKLNQKHCVDYTQIWMQLLDNLRSGSQQPDRLIGKYCDAEVALSHFHDTHNHQSLFALHLAQTIAAYLFGQNVAAVAAASQAQQYADGAFGIVLVAAHNFYQSLALLQLDPQLTQVKENQTVMARWAATAPMNYQHKWLLVEAEFSRVIGDRATAIDLYDQAIVAAQTHGYVQEEGLANELAAKFYLMWGKEKVAASYMQAAYYCYVRWGAQAKIYDLETRYTELLRPILQTAAPTINPWETLATMTDYHRTSKSATTGVNSVGVNQSLDFAAILQVSQSISSTIQLDDLMRQLTQIILQNSGADRCALLLPNESSEWRVHTIGTTDQIQLINDSPISHPSLPSALIYYVKNTQTQIIIDDGETDLPNLREHLNHNQIKSALALPIISQGKLIAILYLENRSASRVFTHDRVLILNFLCTQAAISLDNARIFNANQQATQALQKSQLQLQNLANNLPGIIYQFRLDVAGNTSFPFISNRSHDLFGVAPEVLQTDANALINLVDPSDLGAFQGTVFTSMQTLQPFHWTGRFNIATGQQKWIEASSIPAMQADGSVIWDGVMLDVSDRKFAEQELQNAQLQIVQSEKMSALGNLVAGVAHEINNPVGCIVGNVRATQDYIQDLLNLLDLYAQEFPHPGATITEELETVDLEYIRADLPKLIQAMKDGGERIKAISRSLRTFSRADSETKQAFNIHEGIDSTVLILRHRLKANSDRPEIQILTNYGEVPPLACFPGPLNQVFMNILANAIDALDESNEGKSFSEIQTQPNQITIQTACQDNQVKITIADNGVGMPGAVTSRIFDHLFTTKGVGRGTGLGLAIAQQIIVEKHGGNIAVNSTVGQGTEFVISLPKA